MTEMVRDSSERIELLHQVGVCQAPASLPDWCALTYEYIQRDFDHRWYIKEQKNKYIGDFTCIAYWYLYSTISSSLSLHTISPLPSTNVRYKQRKTIL